MANTQQATRNTPQPRAPAPRTPAPRTQPKAAAKTAAKAAQRSASNDDAERQVDAARERQYWSEQFDRQKDYVAGTPFGDYEHAYRIGYDGFTRYPDKSYAEAEPYLKRDYESLGSRANLAWTDAKSAVRSAWHRVERAMPGDFDRDGR